MSQRENTPALILAILTAVTLASTGFWWVTRNSPRTSSTELSTSKSAFPVSTRSGDSEAKCSTDRLVRKSGNLFGAIEVGSKGIKGKVIQELATKNEDGTKLILFRKEKIEERNVTAVKPESKVETVQAVKSMFEEIQKRFNIPCEQIVIYGSSGLAQKAPHKEALVREIRQATGRAMELITFDEEASLTFDGVVPSWRLGEVVLIDIGSGNTKGAYLSSKLDKHITFLIPFGTTTFTDKVKDTQENIAFSEAAEKEKEKILVPKITSEVQRKPGMQTLPRIYLAGGISWALFTLTRPCSPQYAVVRKREERFDSFAPITPEDINTFYYNATQNQEALYSPNLSMCSDKQREEVQKDIAKIKKEIFTKENLIAGAEFLRAFNKELNFDGKEIFFARSAEDATLIGYLEHQLKNVEKKTTN